MLDTHGRKYVQPAFEKLAILAIKWHLSPIQITIAALFVGLGASVSLGFSYNILAVVLLWLSGLLDVLDGTVARKNNQMSDLGAFLDIIFDRIVEVGLIIAFAITDGSLNIMLVVLASSIVLSMTIFLTTGNFAKNHTEKSFYYQAGVAERTEGFILFSLMVLLPEYRLVIGSVFAAMIVFTAFQRFIEGVKILKH